MGFDGYIMDYIMGFDGDIMGFSQPTLAYYHGDAWESEVVNGEFADFCCEWKIFTGNHGFSMGFPWVFHGFSMVFPMTSRGVL